MELMLKASARLLPSEGFQISQRGFLPEFSETAILTK